MRQIRSKTYSKAPNKKEIRELYLSSFPKKEQLPWFILRMLTLRKMTNITVYYEDDVFCGFTFDVTEGDIFFVMFFAVNSEIRNRGYGSAILDFIRSKYPRKEIMLHIEPLDEAEANYSERVRRLRFYEKNGFYDTGYDVDEVGGTFYVLSTAQTFDEKAYLRLFRKMSFGFWQPVLRRRLEK